MLFGNRKLRKEIIRDALQFGNENNMHLVFGAVVGGISKGLQYADSDYDTRFLYIKKDFPKNIYIPKDCKEDDLKLRKYFEDKPYEWIPFWELSSFLQFLIEPYFEGVFSSGLYNVVGWTFLSPYTWDPYGIQNKITPTIQTVFNCKYACHYHEREYQKYLDKSNDRIIIKNYLYLIHSILSIDWILKYHNFPPVYMRSLLTVLENKKIKREIEKIMYESIEISNKFILKGKSKKMHDSHYIGEINKNEYIEEYIQEILIKYKKVKQALNEKKENQNYKRDIIYNLYELIEYSIKKENQIIDIN